jgi:NAD(P)-dependent dehydrogenase (short-subunit alcohol dehydrogenase family)
MVIVVTGGVQGLGKYLSEQFLQDGHEVATLDLRAEENTGRGIVADVRDEGSAQDACQQILARYGRIDVLINNAGIKYFSPFLEMSSAKVDEAIAVNFKGVCIMTRCVVPVMVRQGFGRIVNISSLASLSGYQGSSIYSATKAAVNMFTRVVAKELPPGITTNAVCPSTIATPETLADMGERGKQKYVSPHQVYKKVKKVVAGTMNGRIFLVVTRRQRFSYLLGKIREKGKVR